MLAACDMCAALGGGYGLDCDSQEACPSGLYCVQGRCVAVVEAGQSADVFGSSDAAPALDHQADAALSDVEHEDGAANVDVAGADIANGDHALQDAADAAVDAAVADPDAAGVCETGATGTFSWAGSFATVHAAGGYPDSWGIVSADFNGDDILDLAVGDAGRDRVAIFLGNGIAGRGDGTFALNIDYLAGDAAAAIAVADFNGDHILDLAVANVQSNDISVLLGLGADGVGNGAFSLDGTYPIVGTEPRDIVAADFDADAIPDVAVANGGGTINIFPGQDTGVLEAPSSYPAGTRPVALAVDDFDADGVRDLAVVDNTGNRVGILLGFGVGGRGDGTLAAPVWYGVGVKPNSIAVADFDSDGIRDLAVTNFDGNSISILTGGGSNGRGNGTFGAAVDLPAGNPQSVLARDFNDDGIADIAVVNYWGNTVSVLLGQGQHGRGNGSFGRVVDYSVGQYPIMLSTGDFNSDDILDLAVAQRMDNGLVILAGDGLGAIPDGTLSPATNLPAGQSPSAIATGDFNNDRIVDLAVVNSVDNDVGVFIGNGSAGRGDGTFSQAIDFSVTRTPAALVVADFNRDGASDLAVANSNSDSVSILLGVGADGLGTGTFAPALEHGVDLYPVSIAAADFNSDAILDLAVVCNHANRVSILLGRGSEGRGDGTFGGISGYTVCCAPMAVATGDFNADRVVDLAVASNGSGDVSILLGNSASGIGDGTFAAAVSHGADGNPHFVAVADFDDDGISDLVVANWNSNNVSLLLGLGDNGRGNGGFTTAVNYPLGSSVFALAVADFSQDGILDLAAVAMDGNASMLLGRGTDGRGDGSLVNAVVYPVGTLPTSVAASDFNGDGILDLAVANQDSDDVSLLFGAGTCR